MADNYIDESGIHTQTVTEIVAELENEYKRIYGQDINIGSDTPDGQRINIEAQAKADVLDFAVQIYNSFDVDAVEDVAQDRLYKINNIYRKSSEFSYVQVNVTASGVVNLQGLDVNEESAYTVSDTNGNQFLLVDSVVLNEGTTLLEFRAKDSGAVEVTPNTITNMVTIVAGVSGVSNPASQYITGTAQESNADFRIRRNKSTAISGKGFYDNLLGDLLSVPLVTAAEVYENDGNIMEIPQEASTSAIWCIVEGGLNEDIGQVIYANKTIGCKQVGNTTVNVTRADGSNFVARFDRPQTQNLYLQLSIKSKLTTPPDVNYIKDELVSKMEFDIFAAVDSSEITASVITIEPTVYVINSKVSTDGVTWVDYVEPSSKDRFFVLSANNIDITVVQ
jgi:hypothetical protein